MKYFIVFIFSAICVFGQQQDKAEYIEYKNEYLRSVEKEAELFAQPAKAPVKSFKMFLSDKQLPKSKSEFKQVWHTDPVNQGLTGTCWSFSTTSFMESENYRINKEKIKLSPIYTVYWEYIEKALGYLQSRGQTVFSEGSQANALFRAWKKHGIVPQEAYTGMKPGQKVHDHSKMSEEILAYLKNLKTQNAWDEQAAIANVKAILNFYLTEPPTEFTYEGKKYTPLTFRNERVKLDLEDYLELVSFTDEPYYSKMEYKVADNWWHSKDYYNVPLDVYMGTLKSAVRSGYSVCFAGDVSEPGINSQYKVALVPDFDIPSQYITAEARQFRFTTGNTADDHGIHGVGYKEEGGKDWYLIKDSGSGSFNKEDKGYYFFHEDYIKLKMLAILVHKDAVGNLLEKFQNR